MQKGIALLLCIFLAFSVQAQEFSSGITGTGIKASYMGALAYPGLSVGVERPYKIVEVTKTKKTKLRTWYKQRALGISANFYHHPDFHSNFFIQGEWTRRKYFLKGLFIESILGVGLSRTFLDGPAFEVSENGEVTKLRAAGSFYGLSSLGLGLGYHLERNGKASLDLFVRPGIMLLFPYSRDVLSRISAQTGVIYRPIKLRKNSLNIERRNK